MKDTLVVNLIGGPGVGKSTLAAGVFAKLKNEHVDCELITEFAKDLVWEERIKTFEDEIYVFAKQEHKLFRLKGKVDVVITDSPLIMVNYYASNDKELCDLCTRESKKYNSLNIVLERKTEYDPNGRNQTLEEAESIDTEMINVLKEVDIDYITIPGEFSSVDKIVKLIKERI